MVERFHDEPYKSDPVKFLHMVGTKTEFTVPEEGNDETDEPRQIEDEVENGEDDDDANWSDLEADLE
jgi:hypothetical protein